MRPVVAALLILLSAPGIMAGQSPGRSTFRILENGVAIGDTEATLARTADGWTVTGSAAMGGSVALEVPRFEMAYDASWRGRSISLEVARGGRTVIAHAIVAVPGARTRTDIVLEQEVRPAFNHVSPHAIFLPDYVLAAFIAVPPRLARAFPGAQLPAFIFLRSEFTLTVQSVATETISTTSGPLATTHWRLLLDDAVPVDIDVWAHDGQLLRVELPGEKLSMKRTDLR